MRPYPLQVGPVLPPPEADQAGEPGQVFTPPALAAWVAERALEWLDRPPDEAVDPAVGTGALLLPLRGRVQRLWGVDTDPRLLAIAARRLPEAELRCGDALAAGLLPDARFDLVIGNPPWLSYSGRQAAALTSARAAELGARFEAWRGWPSLHGVFLERAAQLLAPGGVMALLVPRAVATHAGYQPVRQLLENRGEVRAYDLGEDCFAGIVAPTALILMRAGDPAAVEPAPLALPDWAARLAAWPRVPPATFGDLGVHTGNSAALLLCERPEPGARPVREGRDLRPYRLHPPRRWLRALELPPGHYATIAPPERYAAVPILLRQTADRPIAARHDEPACFRNSLLACYGLPDLPPDVVVAWLNSAPVAAWHRLQAADARQQRFPQVKVRHLRELPLPPLPLCLGPLARWPVEPAAQAEIDRLVATAYGLSPDDLVAMLASGTGLANAQR